MGIIVSQTHQVYIHYIKRWTLRIFIFICNSTIKLSVFHAFINMLPLLIVNPILHLIQEIKKISHSQLGLLQILILSLFKSCHIWSCPNALQYFISFKEPVGSIRPRFSVGSETFAYTWGQGTSFAVMCSAQSNPVPTFR